MGARPVNSHQGRVKTPITADLVKTIANRVYAMLLRDRRLEWERARNSGDKTIFRTGEW